MKSIEEYILESKSLENISDGGSPAYFCDDNLVLVKYSNKNKYGLAREMEEAVRLTANKKRDEGVNTPYHYDVLRVKEEESNYCYVLQDRVKGCNLDTYYYARNSIDRQLEIMNEFTSIPDEHIDKAVLDIAKLFNMGLELKGKNIFYDWKDGFSFIDFLSGNSKEADFDLIHDVKKLNDYMNFLTIPLLPTYRDEYSSDERNKSLLFSNTMRLKIFNSLERVIPNFDKHRRDILRGYIVDELAFFRDNGVLIDDLTLNEEEMSLFNNNCNEFVKKGLEDVANGKYEVWQITANELRINMGKVSMFNNWLYHPLNNTKIGDYKSDYYYRSENNDMLENVVNRMFESALNTSDFQLNNINFKDAFLEVSKEKESNHDK